MAIGLVFAAILSAFPSSAQATGKSSPDVNQAYWRSRFEEAGFSPIRKPNEPAELRRLLLTDPYHMIAVPGVELQWFEDGRTTLLIQYPAWRSETVAVDPSFWTRATANDLVLFEAPRAAEERARTTGPIQPPPICHDWAGLVQTGDGRVALWSGCSRSQTEQAAIAQDVILEIVNAAMTTRPDCEPNDASPFFAFQSCFGIRPELDDPELEAAFAPLRQKWNDASGFAALSEARRSLRAPEMRLGNAAWIDARQAMASFKAVQDERRQLLQQLTQMNFEAYSASDADRFRMKTTLQHWGETLDGQERNYTNLLEQLADASR